MWNWAEVISLGVICRITPRTVVLVWVSTMVFMISQLIKLVFVWCLGIPALTRDSCFCHVYSPEVFFALRVILSNAFQWTCHCREEKQNTFKMQYQCK